MFQPQVPPVTATPSLINFFAPLVWGNTWRNLVVNYYCCLSFAAVQVLKSGEVVHINVTAQPSTPQATQQVSALLSHYIQVYCMYVHVCQANTAYMCASPLPTPPSTSVVDTQVVQTTVQPTKTASTGTRKRQHPDSKTTTDTKATGVDIVSTAFRLLVLFYVCKLDVLCVCMW